MGIIRLKQGYDIFYKKTGNGPVVIFLHNGFYSSLTWDLVRTGFASNFTVIEYDRLGYGRSSHIESLDYDIVEHGVSELEEFVNELGISDFMLVGHCAGGAIAALYTIKHPEKVKKLVLESVGYYGDIKTLLKTDMTFKKYKAIERSLKNILAEMHGINIP